MISFLASCESVSTVNIEAKNINFNNNQGDIIDFGAKNSKGATIRISLNDLFSIKSIPIPRMNNIDVVSYKIGLTTNPDDPENNLISSSSGTKMFTSTSLAGPITLLNVPAGGPYYAYIQAFDSSNNNISEKNRSIIGNIQGYVSSNKVIVSSDNKLVFKTAIDTVDTRNFLNISVSLRNAVPGDNDFNIVSNLNSNLLSPSLSVNESGDGMVVYSKEISANSNYSIYSRKVENFIPVGLETKIDIDSSSQMVQDPKPSISLDNNGTGYIIWSYKDALGKYEIKARAVTLYDPLKKDITVNSTDHYYNNGIFSVSDYLSSFEKRNPRVRVNPSNGRQAMFVWTDMLNDSEGDIFERSINTSYTLNTKSVVNTVASKSQDNARIGYLSSSGNGVIVWEDNRDKATTGQDIYMKTVSSFSTSGGTETKVNTSDDISFPDQFSPEITSDGSGSNGLIIWRENSGGQKSIAARKFINYSPIYASIVNKNQYNLLTDNLIGDKLSISGENFSTRTGVVAYQKSDGIYAFNLRDFTHSSTDNSYKISSSVPVNVSINPAVSINSKGSGIILWDDTRNSYHEIYARHLINKNVVADSNNVNPFGVIAYYPFNYASGEIGAYSINFFPDQSGYSRNGTSANVDFGIYTTDRFGYVASACKLSSNNYIYVPNSDSFFALKRQFTFSLWVTPLSSWTSTQYILDSSILSNFEDGGFALKMNSPDVGGTGQIGVVTKVGGNVIYSSVPITSNLIGSNTYMLSGTYDGRYLKFYINGILKSTYDVGSVKPIDYSYPTNYLIIGGEAGISSTPEANKFFTGGIDDIRIYNFALNDKELTGLYHENGY